jgi:hypothetical protein
MEHEIPLEKHQSAPPITAPTTHDKWWWPQFLAALDKAGYRIVRKPDPELLKKGKSAAQKR